jgi:hypothetical protein
MKSFTHVISQKYIWMKTFIQTNIIMLKKKFVEFLKKKCYKPLYQNSFYIFIKMLKEIKETSPPKCIKNILHFLA